MGFVLTKNLPPYFWPVSYAMPSNGGKKDVIKFELQFKMLPQSAIKEAFQKDDQDAEFIKRVVVGWKDVKDEAGNPVEFSESALDELLDFPTMAKEIFLVYLESLSGTKRKN